MKNKIISLLCLFFVFLVAFNCDTKTVSADDLSNNIEDQLERIDLSELEEYFNSIKDKPDLDFFKYFKNMLSGEYEEEFDSVSEYAFELFLSKIYYSMPLFISIIAIAIFCGIVKNVRGTLLSEGIGDLIVFVGLISIITLLTGEIISLFTSTENVIKNIANLNEITSPIIMTLMLATGEKVSASIYKPSASFLANGIITVMQSIVIPLIELILIFNIISAFSSSVKLNKFSDLFYSTIKWIIGIIVTVFSVFLSVKGITGATFDGISIKAAKYAISNSIPLVGGFISGGFDIMLAGSIIIKNSVGIASVVALFYTILSPVVTISVFNLLLKFVAAVTEPVTDGRISSFCGSISKCVSYLNVVLLVTGLMTFITVLLLVFSANLVV